MAERTIETGVAAGILVVRETGDGARFLLIGRGNEWRLPIAVAGNFDDAAGDALREAREISGLSDIAPSWPPVWFDAGSHRGFERRSNRVAEQTGGSDRRQQAGTQARHARYLLATAPAADAVAKRPGQGDIACWVDLDQGLQLTNEAFHAPLVQAAALLMKTATLA
jgi:hypothetical protein